MPVRVEQGSAPDNLDIRQPEVSPAEVTVSGPQSVIDRIVAARADVIIEPNGLDIDRDVELIPVDVVGDRVTPADVEPRVAHVRIAVFRDQRQRSLVVNPVVTGSPAVGFEIAQVTAEPIVVLVEGDDDQLAALTAADTAPLSISGATQDVTADVPLNLPAGILRVGGDETVAVTVAIRPIAATRVFDAGMSLEGERPDLDYRLSTNHALATVGGPLSDLERLDGAAFALVVQVSGLGIGTHEVPLQANLPVGLSLVGVDPDVVTVTIAAATSTNPSAAP